AKAFHRPNGALNSSRSVRANRLRPSTALTGLNLSRPALANGLRPSSALTGLIDTSWRRIVQIAKIGCGARFDVDGLAVLALGAAEPAARAVPDHELVIARRGVLELELAVFVRDGVIGMVE